MVQGTLPHLSSSPGSNSPVNMESSSLTQTLSNMLKDVRPWREFFDIQKISKPNALSGPSSGSVQTRLNGNLTHFKMNYFVIIAILTALILLTNWVFLLSVIIIGAGYVLLERFPENMTYSLFGRVTLTKQQLIYIWAVCSGILLLFTSAGGSIFWLLGINGFIVGLHAVLRDPEVLDLGEFAPLETAA